VSDTETRSGGNTPRHRHRSDGRKTIAGIPLARSGTGRVFKGQTAIDFVGRRRFGLHRLRDC
jgi:hypothetical protein